MNSFARLPCRCSANVGQSISTQEGAAPRRSWLAVRHKETVHRGRPLLPLLIFRIAWIEIEITWCRQVHIILQPLDILSMAKASWEVAKINASASPDRDHHFSEYANCQEKGTGKSSSLAAKFSPATVPKTSERIKDTKSEDSGVMVGGKSANFRQGSNQTKGFGVIDIK